jgi:CHAD domain-containing protein
MDICVDAGYQLLASRYMRKQARQLAGQIDGVRLAEDIEYIHRARVATRRLRAGLRVFADCYDRPTIKRWQKAVRQLTKGLGKARDADVQCAFALNALIALESREHYPGIARLMVKLDRRREKVQPKVNEALDRFESTGVLKELSSEMKKTSATLEKRDVSVQSAVVFEKAGQHILARLEELLGYRDCLSDPEQQDRHHAMRIAAKRLRYTMEMCKPAYDSQLDEFISSSKEIQSLLGDIHDCDVWTEYFEQFLAKERDRIVERYGHDGPLRRLRVGIDHLDDDCRRRRKGLFWKLGDYWSELERQGLWENLVEMVRSRIAACAERDLPLRAADSEAGGLFEEPLHGAHDTSFSKVTEPLVASSSDPAPAQPTD